jgi:hypothetical protein
MADTLEQRLAVLTAALDDLAKSMRLAKQYQPAALPGLQQQFRQIMAQAAALRAQENQADQPAAFMLALSDFSDKATAVANQLGGDALDAVKGVTGTIRILPWLIGGAVLLLGAVLFIGFKKGSLKANLTPGL